MLWWPQHSLFAGANGTMSAFPDHAMLLLHESHHYVTPMPQVTICHTQNHQLFMTEPQRGLKQVHFFKMKNSAFYCNVSCWSDVDIFTVLLSVISAAAGDHLTSAVLVVTPPAVTEFLKSLDRDSLTVGSVSKVLLQHIAGLAADNNYHGTCTKPFLPSTTSSCSKWFWMVKASMVLPKEVYILHIWICNGVWSTWILYLNTSIKHHQHPMDGDLKTYIRYGAPNACSLRNFLETFHQRY